MPEALLLGAAAASLHVDALREPITEFARFYPVVVFGLGFLLALTAQGRPDEDRRALDAGFQAFLRKPVEARELAAALARAGRAAPCGPDSPGRTV